MTKFSLAGSRWPRDAAAYQSGCPGFTRFLIMPRILAIEDDETTATEIVAELEEHGFSVTWARDGHEGLRQALQGGYDAITLDRMLPGLDGLDVLSALRNAGRGEPVLMISALSDVDERVRGLRAGGDDYLTKPFAPEELVVRLEALLRRRRTPQNPSVLRCADLEMDLLQQVVRRNGQVVNLSPTEFSLLEFLLRNSNQVVSRTMLFEAVWGYYFDPGTKLIDVHIARLRKKIDTADVSPLVQTVRGVGYVLGRSG